MFDLTQGEAPASDRARQESPQFEPNLSSESPGQRARRIYRAQGGALIGWLFDEARRRRHDLKQMAEEVGVTYGYINQLRSGIRSTANLSQLVVEGCAHYLGVPPIIIKFVAGVVSVRDFAFPRESEEEMVERAVRQLLDDPHVRATLPGDIATLPIEAKRALVLLYAESSGTDVLHARALPDVMHWLQRTAVIHNEREVEVART
jgi:transcriptional regulator with XRE-family HTH domain